MGYYRKTEMIPIRLMDGDKQLLLKMCQKKQSKPFSKMIPSHSVEVYI